MKLMKNEFYVLSEADTKSLLKKEKNLEFGCGFK